jgi:hypothetical protein
LFFSPRSSTLDGSPDPLSQPFARIVRIRRPYAALPAPATGSNSKRFAPGNPHLLHPCFRSHPSSS